jgi:hypothetical protein
MSSIKCTVRLIVDQDDMELLTFKHDRISKFLGNIVKTILHNHRHYSIDIFKFQELQDQFGDPQTTFDLRLVVDGELTNLELKKALDIVIDEFRRFEYVFDCQYDNVDIIECKLPVEKTRKVVKKQGNEITEFTEKNGKGRKLFILKE